MDDEDAVARRAARDVVDDTHPAGFDELASAWRKDAIGGVRGWLRVRIVGQPIGFARVVAVGIENVARRRFGAGRAGMLIGAQPAIDQERLATKGPVIGDMEGELRRGSRRDLAQQPQGAWPR